MKYFLLCILFSFQFIVTQAQNVSKATYRATFNYINDAAVLKAIDENKLEFSLAGIKTQEQLNEFYKTTAFYTSFFTVKISNPHDEGVRICSVTFTDGKNSMGILRRLLASNNIHQVTYMGSTVNADDFFFKFQKR